MSEHKICVGCTWNKYPECLGFKMFSGEFMNIENLRPTFNCGQKDNIELTDFSIVKKSELELRLEELEQKIAILEEK